MLYIFTLTSILETLILIVPSLLIVAFVTVAERKTMASMQRRLGPNAVGWYGLLQAFADALKLLLKEYISPTQSNIILFFIGPVITLIFALLGYIIIPYSPGLAILDFNLSILYALAVSSLATYGILLAGWSANSKYAFLGSLRSTAQLISYELILSSAILLVILLSGSLNISVIIESQKNIWYIFPLFPIFIVFFIGAVAETNRAPFDLAEAESELVSGFMTEHSAVVFVFFFLAEYASIVLICITTSILFLGGYLLLNVYELCQPFIDLYNFFVGYVYESPSVYDKVYSTHKDYLYSDVYEPLFKPTHRVHKDLSFSIDYIKYIFSLEEIYEDVKYIMLYIHYVTNRLYFVIINNPLLTGLFNPFILALKTSIMVFTFIWVRASFPRVRFDSLMTYCWTILLPILIAFIVFIPFILYNFSILPSNIITL